MAIRPQARLLRERAIDGPADPRGCGLKRPVRSVTVNLAESPLGWLLARGLVSQRQKVAALKAAKAKRAGRRSPKPTTARGRVKTGSRARKRPTGRLVPRRARADPGVFVSAGQSELLQQSHAAQERDAGD